MGNNVELNAKLKAMQTYADRQGNQNGKVDTSEEIIIFENLADKKYENGELDDEMYNQAMGLYKTNPAETTTPVADNEPSKYLGKGIERDYFRVLDNESKTMTRAELRAHMVNTYDALSNTKNVGEYQKAFDEVLAEMPEAYESLKDIKNQHEKVVAKLERAGLKDKLHLAILKQLEVAAENEVTSDVATEVKTDFQQRLQKIAEKGDFTQEATIKAMYEEIKKEEKSAKEIDDKKAKAKAEAQIKDKKEALKQLEETTVISNAKRYVHEAITSVLQTSKDSEGAIQDAAISYLKEHKMWDKYTKDLMSRANLLKKDSYGEALVEKQQRVNRVRASLIQSEKEIKDALGKNDSELFSSLLRTGLVTKTDDGKYDLTALSLVLGNLVGQDFTRSATSKENREISEKVRTTGVMSEKTGFADLKPKEAKELLKLCGYDIEGVDFAKVAKGTLIGAAFNALAGALAAATNPNQDVTIMGGNITQDVTINLEGNFKFTDLPDGAEIIQNGVSTVIKIHQAVQRPDILIEISKCIPATALKTALAGALGGALASLKPDGEAWITATQFAETDITKYAKQVKHMNPKYADQLMLLAETFVKDGKWDVEAYKQFLNKYAGDGSPLNEKEFYSAVEDRMKELGAPVVPPKEPVECDDEETCEASIKQQQGIETTSVEDKTHIHNRKAGDTWKGIVEAYYPGLVEKCGGLWGKNGAIKALQRELCTDENGNFDKAKFNALISATDIPKEMKMPLVVNGINRQINAVKAGKFIEAKGDEIKKAPDKAGRDEKVSITQVTPGTYVATDNCDSSQKAIGTTKAEALQKLKEKTGKDYSNEAELLKD